MKRALITGITGQDGAYLARFLLGKGYEVYGTYRRLSTPNFWRLQSLDVFDRIHLIPADLVDAGSIIEALRTSEPDEVYHLAAQSFVGASFEEPIGTGEMTGLGVTRILEAIRQIDPEIRFYQASTSELFGNSGSREALTEESSFRPSSPYAAAKLYGYWITRIYRSGGWSLSPARSPTPRPRSPSGSRRRSCSGTWMPGGTGAMPRTTWPPCG
jgi:GDPmannose 4,6-dehydratase